MRSADKWKPSKYVRKGKKLRASRDPSDVAISSRLIVDILASYFERYLNENYVKGRVLDLGCGKVPLYEVYHPWAISVTCVDWVNSTNNEHVDHELDLTLPLPFPDSQFDTIILSDVLEHIPVPHTLWKEMARILAPSGKIIVTVPYYYPLHEAPYDYYRYTKFGLRRFVENAGLRLKQLEAIGGAPEIMTDILAKTVKRLPVMGPAIASFAQWFTWRFLHTRFGRRISEATKEDFPFGYFLIAEKG